MASFLEISPENLYTLTAEQLKGRRVAKWTGPSQPTAEQMAKLRQIVFEMDQPGAVKTDELGERLKPPLDSPPSPTASSSSCETPSIGEMERSCEEGAYKHYETLLQMGGRPTCSINPDPGVWDPAKVNQEDIHVLNHWGVEMIRAHDELDRWKHFRTFQQTNRARPETFSRYQELVLNYRLENGMEGTAHLHLQPEEQTKLDEWREYQFYEHRKLGRLQRIVKQAEETAESARKRLDAAESDKSRNAIHDALLIYQGGIRSAEINVERFNELLSWIDSQFPLIVSEGSLSHPETGGEGHHSRDQEPTGDVASHSKASTKIDQKSQDQKKRHSKALGAVHSGKIIKAVHKRPRLVLPQQHLPHSAGSLSEDNPDKGLPDGAAQPPSLMDQTLV